MFLLVLINITLMDSCPKIDLNLVWRRGCDLKNIYIYIYIYAIFFILCSLIICELIHST